MRHIRTISAAFLAAATGAVIFFGIGFLFDSVEGARFASRSIYPQFCAVGVLLAVSAIVAVRAIVTLFVNVATPAQKA